MDYEKMYLDLREKYSDLSSELSIVKAMADGDTSTACSWLQMKVDRQKKALDLLNRKVLSQRFRLRTIALMGRDLTKEEYEAAKAQLENPLVQERVLEYAEIS